MTYFIRNRCRWDSAGRGLEKAIQVEIHVLDVAPGVSVSKLRNTAVNSRDAMEAGQVDLATVFLPELKAGFLQCSLCQQAYVCMFRHESNSNVPVAVTAFTSKQAQLAPRDQLQSTADRGAKGSTEKSRTRHCRLPRSLTAAKRASLSEGKIALGTRTDQVRNADRIDVGNHNSSAIPSCSYTLFRVPDLFHLKNLM